MTVKLRGPAGGVIEVADDAADRYIAAGYTAETEPENRPEPDGEAKPRRRRKGG